jgi:hypothetical protein
MRGYDGNRSVFCIPAALPPLSFNMTTVLAPCMSVIFSPVTPIVADNRHVVMGPMV